MTSGPLTHTLSPPTPLRLRLNPAGPATGDVDGTWWPRSRNLATELPALAEVLAVRLGRIVRVAYALSAWDPGPRRFEVDGYRVRLDGFNYQDQNIIHVTGTNRGRISLLFIPAEMAVPEEILAAPHLPAPRQPHE